MYIQFLIEDASSELLVENVMEKYREEGREFSYSCKSFKGIGHYPKLSSPKQAKTNKLLNDLPLYLKGFEKSLQNLDASIFVIIDNDNRDIKEFHRLLVELSERFQIKIDHVFCIAIEEVEAWLLGDQDAIEIAYPEIRERIKKKILDYEQDSICGTWEILADILYDGGITKFMKDNPSYMEIGRHKSEWSQRIGKVMNIRENQSPSFRYFLSQLDKRIISA